MPIRIEQITEPDDGFVICEACEGWGGKDNNSCYGFGASFGDNWQDCFICHGAGQRSIKEVEAEEAYREHVRKRREERGY